jgi:lysyl endopeptidase
MEVAMDSKQNRRISTISLLLGAILLTIGSVKAQVKIGSVLPQSSETPHPYAVGKPGRPVVWQERVISPGAKVLRVHFVGFSLSPGDYLTISGPDGSEALTYEGNGPYGDGDFWSVTIDGNEAVIALHGGPSPGYGYRIDSIAHGDFALDDAEAIEADDETDCKSGYENVACHEDNPQFCAGQQAVAKLTFQADGKMYVATGWLVIAKSKNILITNAHNLTDDKVARSTNVDFNYQTPKCNGGPAGRDRYEVFKVLERNDSDDLDYVLVQLLGNAEKKWKPLRASTKDIKEKSAIWVPQHPGGEVKQVGWFVDNAHKALCTVAGFRAPNDVKLMCAAVPGTSGSPVLDGATPKETAIPDAIALMARAQPTAKCPTIGIKMSAICADDAKNKKILVCANK